MKLLTLAVAAALAATPTPAATTVAITGATLIGWHGDLHPNTTVLLAGSRIKGVYTGDNKQEVGALSAPSGARHVDAHGMVLSAGLFDAASRVGLTELGEDDVARDALGTDGNHPVQAGLRVADGFYPAATAIPVTRSYGVTTAALVPGGGLLSGQGAVVDLAGPTSALDGTVVVPSLGQFGAMGVEEASLPTTAARARTLAALRELMALGRGPALPADRLPFNMGLLDYQAVRTLAAGQTRLYLSVHRASDIVNALAFGRDQHLPLVLMGCEEGWMVAPQLAAAHVPVVIDPTADLPTSLESRGSRLDNAALLHRAGVRVAFGTWSSENARNLRQAAGIAVANGMPWAAAWNAVTAEPAEIHGLRGRYGEVLPGQVANLVLWSGDPFELSTAVRHVFIHGREISLENRQKALQRRYRRVPV